MLTILKEWQPGPLLCIGERRFYMDERRRTSDEEFMAQALELAREAERAGEVPVGAVVVLDGVVIGRGRNAPVKLRDPSAHAEMVALRQAALAIGNYRVERATLYSTLEPCVMCAGLLVAARVERLVFGARDLRFGGVRSKFRIADSELLNHRVEIVEGVMGAECAELMQRFFQSRR
jgi:tRNA(adenine34) deaminase